MDLKLDGTSGFEAIRRIHDEDPSSHILVLSNFQGSEDVYLAMQAGARGYLTKDADGPELVNALQAVASGSRYRPKCLESRLAEYIPKGGITPRELVVLELLAKGMSTAEIAQQSDIAEKTVRIHISNVLEKLGARDRTQALILALKSGIIHLDP
jgi:DNA-binding NarL/FixJ family response regulator